MIYTVGHSTLPWDEFLRLIEPVELLVDIRSHPSSKWPQYNQERLQRELGERYQWWPSLGGWTEHHQHLAPRYPEVDTAAYATGSFPKQRIAARVEQTDGLSWTNQGLLDYAWYMSTDEFLAGAERLLQLGDPIDIGIMCCEAVPWRCHRSMVSDYVVYRTGEAYHLQPQLRAHSAVIGNRVQRYPKAVRAMWRQRANSAQIMTVG